MRPVATLLLTFNLFPLLATCAEPAEQTQPATQTQPVVETTPAASADPADLLPKGKAPLEGLLTGGQPTAEQLRTLAGLGYTTVVNMRGANENGSTDPALVESLGMTYVAIPVTGAADVNENNARRLAEVLAASEGPAVVHCASANRVGALFALKAYYVDGQPAEDALTLAKTIGVTRLEPVVKQQLGLE